MLVCSYESTNGETYADLAGGNQEFQIGQQITQTVAEKGLSGKVAYVYGDPIGGSSVYTFRDGMQESLKDNEIEVVGELWAQDCDLAALQRILAGTQVSTVLKSGSEYLELFVNACIDYYLGELTAEDFDSREKNCDGKEIPFMSYDSKVITIDNVDDAIEAGLYTYEEIYQK